MEYRKGIIALLVTGVIIFLSIPVWAAMPSSMSIVGEIQGNIEGSSAMQGREGSIIVYGFNHRLYIPTDPQSGLSTSNRVHGPFKILKIFDKSSPKLYQALLTGERLKSVKIRFYRVDPTGIEENYFTIELRDAIIVDISMSTPSTLLPENQAYNNMETVSFSYRNIIWTWEPDGIQTEDNWEVPKS